MSKQETRKRINDKIRKAIFSISFLVLKDLPERFLPTVSQTRGSFPKCVWLERVMYVEGQRIQTCVQQLDIRYFAQILKRKAEAINLL